MSLKTSRLLLGCAAAGSFEPCLWALDAPSALWGRACPSRVLLAKQTLASRSATNDLVAIFVRPGQMAGVGGTAIFRAPRVEPLVEPGQIWAAEAFCELYVQQPSHWRTVPLYPPPGEGELFSVAKKGTGEAAMRVPSHPGRHRPRIRGQSGLPETD